MSVKRQRSLISYFENTKSQVKTKATNVIFRRKFGEVITSIADPFWLWTFHSLQISYCHCPYKLILQFFFCLWILSQRETKDEDNQSTKKCINTSQLLSSIIHTQKLQKFSKLWQILPFRKIRKENSLPVK